MNSWTELQVRQGEWQKKNFPNAEKWECVLGIVEELKEYDEAFDSSEIIDAAADTMIYILGLCNANEYNIEDIVNFSVYDDDELNIHLDSNFSLLKVAGNICHAYLKMHQGIRKNEDHMSELYKNLKIIYLFFENRMYWEDRDIFEETKRVFEETVEKRDWVNKDGR